MKEHLELLANGEESFAFWGRGRAAENEHELCFASDLEVKADALFTRLDGKAGFHSKTATKRLLARLDDIQPDVVHLHNLHGYYVNIEMLFKWLERHECRVEWTLHDCWALTGHCAYFTYAQCPQWQSHCAKYKTCPQLDTYPKTFSKTSCSWNYEKKKLLFNLVPFERMKLIVPSEWLANLVKRSFLSNYQLLVKPNQLDKSIFHPTKGTFRDDYGLNGKFILLGVAYPWSKRKGLDYFKEIANRCGDKIAIVLVGVSKYQQKLLPDNIICIPKIDNRRDLACIYSAADLYLNPSIEETFGMTVLEACSCGCKVAFIEGSACAEAARGFDSLQLPSERQRAYGLLIDYIEKQLSM